MYPFTIFEAKSPKSRYQQVWFLLGSSEGESIPCLSPSSWWLLAILASLAFSCNHCHMAPLSPGCLALCICLHMAFAPLCVSKFSPFYEDTSHWNRAHSNPVWLHLKLITSAKTLFLNKVPFMGTGVRTSTLLSVRHNSTHNSYPPGSLWALNAFCKCRSITLDGSKDHI